MRPGIVGPVSISEVIGGEVFGRDELLQAGFGDQEIRAALTDGSLLRLHRGVYAPGLRDRWSRRTPIEVLRILGVARRSPSMVVSHAAAAVLYRIPLWRIDPNVVHLTRRPGGGAVRRPGRIVHSAAFADDEVVQRHGVNVTSVARTVVDLARTYGFESSVIACDYALHERLVTPADLVLALDRARQRPGRRAASRALAFADGRAESPGESRTRVLMSRAGLDAPDLQVEVRDRSGAVLGRTDLGYQRDATLIEFDGKVKYQKLLRPGQTPSDAVIAEKRREDEIRSAGFAVLRIVWSELAAPDLLVSPDRRDPATRTRVAGVGRDVGVAAGRARRSDRVTLQPSASALQRLAAVAELRGMLQSRRPTLRSAWCRCKAPPAK